MRAGSSRQRAAVLATVAIAIVAVLALALRQGRDASDVRVTIALARALGGVDTVGYARAVEPRVFSFPADHGPHPGFRTEWWYFTGNLADARGRRFGYQLTFFRNAIRPDPVQRSSAWGADVVFMAHFTVTDADGGEFHAYERFERAALGLAGARLEPFRVWTDDWSAAGVDATPFPIRLRAAEAGVAIDLRLAAGKPAVLQGDAGLSQKSEEPGNASYYYSMTRLPTDGDVVIQRDTFRVTGTSWMDREWSTSALPDGVVGWDWFALQLDDSTELMFYRLRDEQGHAAPFSAGRLVARDGSSTPLAAGDVISDVLETWTSPLDGVRYPSRWRVGVPAAGLELEVRSALADQELRLAVRYWEGAVTTRGTRAGAAVSGRGYVELTGYADTGAR